MKFSRLLYLSIFLFSSFVQAEEEREGAVLSVDPKVGSWTFSGMVKNEEGERFGYFFQLQKQGINFHTQTALIDGKTNKLVFFYEGDEVIRQPNPLNWHVGQSFIRYNTINDSWIFGVNSANKKGFNFKVDMLKVVNNDKDTLVLRPGMELQTLQTSRLNGHIKLEGESSEQFVTGNTAWFGRLWFTKDQITSHAVSTTFCRLNNEQGFYSARLKEEDAMRGSVAGWRNETGGRVPMSQFVSMKSLDHDQFLLSLSWPKYQLQLENTLKSTSMIAGFSNQKSSEFCYVADQTFAKADNASSETA